MLDLKDKTMTELSEKELTKIDESTTRRIDKAIELASQLIEKRVSIRAELERRKNNAYPARPERQDDDGADGDEPRK